MLSSVKTLGSIHLTHIYGEFAMMPFNLHTLDGLSGYHRDIAMKMLDGIKHAGGIAFLTLHGRTLAAGNTLRRPGPHTDGNYEPHKSSWKTGGGGWKVGENGPAVGTELHERQYNTTRGGIILASNVSACRGWVGEFDASPKVGGDCSHIQLGEGFKLEKDQIYYGNNHFIHESIPVEFDCHRIFARITMPEDHVFS